MHFQSFSCVFYWCLLSRWLLTVAWLRCQWNRVRLSQPTAHTSQVKICKSLSGGPLTCKQSKGLSEGKWTHSRAQCSEHPAQLSVAHCVCTLKCQSLLFICVFCKNRVWILCCCFLHNHPFILCLTSVYPFTTSTCLWSSKQFFVAARQNILHPARDRKKPHAPAADRNLFTLL